jgi:glutathione S-transferase
VTRAIEKMWPFNRRERLERNLVVQAFSKYLPPATIESLVRKPGPWPAVAALDQAQITTACMLRYVQTADPELIPPSRYPALESLSQRCEARAEFRDAYPPMSCTPGPTE